MKSASRSVAGIACLYLSALLVGCGGSSHASTGGVSAQNSQTVVVNGGPNGNYANGLFTTVNICAPGSSNCTSISGVLVDTGSYGLRVLSSALGGVNGSLPQQKDASGKSVLECAQFVDSVLWGPVKTADVAMANEKASALPIQVIDSSVVPLAAGCKAIGPAEQTLSSLGANGILGIGFFLQDCGSACSVSGSTNPGFYYSCAGASCQVAAEPASQQVRNPVGSFPTDNNGIVVQLPATSGATSLTGSLIFGIGTSGNNALGSAQIFPPDSFGNLKTTFKANTYAGFIDSGSNGYFFLDSSITSMPECPSSENGFYCPSSPVNFSATNNGGTSSNTVDFSIGNASELFATNSAAAFPTLGGPNPASFDWGLPFFFGRKVFVAIEGAQTPAGAGPFWAY